ncbi:hypothetical protein [Bradyrhizobium sp. 191]|uniref:hypothetical protein n=1 Tax=Bradyrhizobium sp. 191 TaxID=2782659 RepID=UPI001FFE569E|nr:hypothetical protein [Bradyrhizobium sp. 191]UPJ68526.1 hypothetical protein IVB23_15450 [Bradyrhizobium sp. 191]
MKTPLGTFDLFNKLTQRFERASLFEGIDESNLHSFEQDWKIAFEARVPADATTVERLAANAQDAHWDWRRLAEIRDNPLLYQMYAVECAGRMQGIMLVKKGGRFSRHPDHSKADLVYIDRLSTAPWNRRGFVAEPIYQGVGVLLLATAMNLSFEEGLDGRIGLHSLSGAEAFYRDVIGMTDFGPDADKYGMRYFEMSSAQAQAFLNPQERDGA